MSRIKQRSENRRGGMIIKTDVLHELRFRSVRRDRHSNTQGNVGGSEGDQHSLLSYWTTSIHHDASFVIDTLGQSELIKLTQEPWGSSDDLDLSNSGSHILHLPFLPLML